MATSKKFRFSDLVAASESCVVTDEKVKKLMERLSAAEKRFAKEDKEREKISL